MLLVSNTHQPKTFVQTGAGRGSETYEHVKQEV